MSYVDERPCLSALSDPNPGSGDGRMPVVGETPGGDPQDSRRP